MKGHISNEGKFSNQAFELIASRSTNSIYGVLVMCQTDSSSKQAVKWDRASLGVHQCSCCMCGR
eukprot:scaffold89079_cov19-Tisochrysis_lutea.AAC.1